MTPRQTMRGALLLLLLAAPAQAQQLNREWLAARYETSFFDDDTDAWQLGSVEVGARGTRLTPIARVNWASRNGGDGVQLEGDLYPSWPGVGYGYLSVAWSEGAPFPELRLHGEAFALLPNAFELSAGATWMDFDDDDVTIVIASLSKYTGNYWLAARPSWIPEDNDVAVTLIARRYLRSAGEYVTLRMVAGSTPEEVATRGETSLETIGASADAQLQITPRWLVLPVVGVAREELTADRTRMRYTVGVGGMYRF